MIFTKFLWLPKKINGNWYWLRKVKYECTERFITVDGKVCIQLFRKYYMED